jgi:citrate lyase subunit gamma (acyl carrier protein)
MSQIIRRASAGTLESSDVLVQIAPSDDGLHIRLDSVVQAQFGDDILSVVKEVLDECGIEQANLNIQDRGALDCVIRARVETAIIRGKG